MFNFLAQFQSNIVSEKIVPSVLILILAFIAKALAFTAIRASITKIEDDDPTTNTALEQRAYTLGHIIKNTLNIMVYGVAFITILSRWGVNIAPILTGAGILGLAVGFGAQSLAKDIINGFFILLENQFNIGDHIKISGLDGEVLKMNLRNTVLKTPDGEIHSIPNSKIAIVTKYTKKQVND